MSHILFASTKKWEYEVHIIKSPKSLLHLCIEFVASKKTALFHSFKENAPKMKETRFGLLPSELLQKVISVKYNN